LAVKLLPDDKLHPQGQTVSFEIGNLKYPYLTLVNLTVDGQIYFLYPSLQKDTLVVPVNKPFRLDDLEVTEPFGADHLLAIVTDKPLTDFHEKIKQLDNSINSLHEFVQSLVFALRDTKYQIGIHANFTTSHL